MESRIVPKQIYLDFDGVFVRNENPRIGSEVDHAVRVVKRLQDAGHTLILVTMRVDELLAEAKQWLVDRGVKIDYFNMNPMYETGSRKIYAHIIIDDKCCGIPMVYHPRDGNGVYYKPFVDWKAVEKILENQGYL